MNFWPDSMRWAMSTAPAPAPRSGQPVRPSRITPESMSQCWMRWWMSKRTTIFSASGSWWCPLLLLLRAAAQLVDRIHQHVEGEEEQGAGGQVAEGDVDDVRHRPGVLERLVGDEAGEAGVGGRVALGAGLHPGVVLLHRRQRATPPTPAPCRRRCSCGRPWPPGRRGSPSRAARAGSPATTSRPSIEFLPVDGDVVLQAHGPGELGVAVAGLAALGDARRDRRGSRPCQWPPDRASRARAASRGRRRRWRQRRPGPSRASGRGRRPATSSGTPAWQVPQAR